MGRTGFSDRFRNIIIRHKRIGNDLNNMRQSAYLFFFSFSCLLLLPVTDSIRILCFDNNSIYLTTFMHLKLQTLRERHRTHYATNSTNFEKVDGAYCFWSVGACVRGSHFLHLLLLLNR